MIQDKVLKPIEKLNSGGFGCVYKNLPCSNNDPQENQDKYVEKMQLAKYAQHELKMGERIQEIKHYDFYFAPLLKICEIDINILNEELQQCDAIQTSRRDQDEKIITTKIKNMGNKTLTKIVDEWDQKYMPNQPKQFMRLFLESFLYLLHSLTLLQEHQIIHNDLKENNIMYDEINKCPVLIDFGFSINHQKKIDFKNICLTEDCQKEESPFIESIYYTRCFEQGLMAKLYKNYLPEKTFTTKQELLGYMEDFIGKEDEHNNFNTLFQKNNDKDMFRAFYQKKIEEWTRLGTEDNIPIDQCFDAIYEFAKNKMDVYSLLITYLYLMEYDEQLHFDLEKKERLEKAPYLTGFKEMIRDFALAPEYTDIMELKEEVQKLFNRLYFFDTTTTADTEAETTTATATTTTATQPSTIQSFLFPRK